MDKIFTLFMLFPIFYLMFGRVSREEFIRRGWHKYNASLIKYSDEDFVKKIIVKRKSKNFLNPDTKYRQNLMIGEIFFENGDHYEGELWHDQPIGLGTMTYKDGSKDSGSFGGDGIFEGKKN